MRHETFRNRPHTIIRAAALTAFIFGFCVWVFAAVIAVRYGHLLSKPFAHLQFPPFDWRLDNVGMLAFAVSAAGFFVYQVERDCTEVKQ